MVENMEDKFTKLAEMRVNNAIKQLQLIGNLSNRNRYSYKNEQIKSIFSALTAELDKARQRFKDDARPREKPFKL